MCRCRFIEATMLPHHFAPVAEMGITVTNHVLCVWLETSVSWRETLICVCTLRLETCRCIPMFLKYKKGSSSTNTNVKERDKLTRIWIKCHLLPPHLKLHLLNWTLTQKMCIKMLIYSWYCNNKISGTTSPSSKVHGEDEKLTFWYCQNDW